MKRKNNRKRLSENDLRAALNKCGGNMSDAARLLDVNRKTVQRWVKTHPSLAACLTESKEELRKRLVWKAVQNLETALDRGDWKATELVLKSRAAEPEGFTPATVKQEVKAETVELTPEEAAKKWKSLFRM